MVFLCDATNIQVEDASLSDDAVAKMILERFRQSSVVISFTEIARFAKEKNRRHLVFQVPLCS